MSEEKQWMGVGSEPLHDHRFVHPYGDSTDIHVFDGKHGCIATVYLSTATATRHIKTTATASVG